MGERTPHIVAAVDLGSNSFHMKVARVVDGHFHVVDRLKEMVRLAAGLDAEGRLDAQAVARALACLERFGQRLRDIPPEGVRVVGTNTLRRARNAAEFLREAKRILGHPIEIISGIEEARLVYLGVAHSVPQTQDRRLVVDIGGGSTEVIIGRGFKPLYLESLYMGCVGFSRCFFGDGIIDAGRMRRAELAAMQELEPLATPYRRLGWDAAIGSSGTVVSIAEVIRHKRWGERGITAPGLARLRESLIAAGHVERLDLPGLERRRAPVFPGGVAILSALFETLGIKRMERSLGALREGLLYDLLGRLGPEDVRETTVLELMSKHRVDEGQAARVERTAMRLREQVTGSWGLGKERWGDCLRWAASLHEVGLAIAHSGYHKHGAYLLEHADLAGFSQEEQLLLAALVRAHRRKFPPQAFAALPGGRTRARRLAVLLRVAAVLHRSRSDSIDPEVVARADGDSLSLELPEGWLAAHPLTQADLEQEAAYLRAAGFKLTFG